MVDPQLIMHELISFIGDDHATIAGGAVRDVVLHRTPKDYDVFFLNYTRYEQVCSERGIFDVVPKETNIRITAYVNTRYTVFETTLRGQRVQLIWQKDFIPPSYSTWSRKCYYGKDKGDERVVTAQDVINRFDYTINMMYYTWLGGVYVSPQAQEAMRRCELLFNEGHTPAFSNPIAIVSFMTRRAIYLAEKLDYTISVATIEQIYKRYMQDNNMQYAHLDSLSKFEWWPCNTIF